MTLEEILKNTSFIDGHHIWKCYINYYGLPVLKIDKKQKSVRKVIFEKSYGEVLETYMAVVCNCGVNNCVSPDHLELTNKSNTHLFKKKK